MHGHGIANVIAGIWFMEFGQEASNQAKQHLAAA